MLYQICHTLARKLTWPREQTRPARSSSTSESIASLRNRTPAGTIRPSALNLQRACSTAGSQADGSLGYELVLTKRVRVDVVFHQDSTEILDEHLPRR